jgi:predicted thioredoxin/glutaredoxin
MSDFIKKKLKDPEEFESKYIKRKKKKIDLGEIVSKAMNKQDKPQYITKKKKTFITKKSPEKIREREMVKKASGGRIGLKAGSNGCKLAMKGKGRAYGKNS